MARSTFRFPPGAGAGTSTPPHARGVFAARAAARPARDPSGGAPDAARGPALRLPTLRADARFRVGGRAPPLRAGGARRWPPDRPCSRFLQRLRAELGGHSVAGDSDRRRLAGARSRLPWSWTLREAARPG